MTTTYDKQAQDFLARFGVKFSAVLSNTQSAPWIGTEPPRSRREPNHYKVTLRKAGKTLAFDFWGSIADAEAGKTTLEPYDVLACIGSDSTCPETFEDFCSEYGYDTDSIKAQALFNRCHDFAKRLNRFFTAEELEALQQIQ